MSQDIPSSHPLDGCDEGDLYSTMMAERAVLVTAQREAQDTLIKTIIQLSSALIALIAGFVSQSKMRIYGASLIFFAIIIALLGLSIISGLLENFFSTIAYKQQQNALESYYSKESQSFAEPQANKVVRRAQASSFICFVAALSGLGIFAILEAKGQKNVEEHSTSGATTSATTTSAAATSTGPSAVAAITIVPSYTIRRGPRCRIGHEIGRSFHATTSAKETMTR